MPPYLRCVLGCSLLFMAACGGGPPAESPPPAIAGPADPMPYPGASVTLEAQIRNHGLPVDPAAYTYQWFKDGDPISGANGPTLHFPSITLDDGGGTR